MRRSGGRVLKLAVCVVFSAAWLAACSSQPITQDAFTRSATEGASLVSAASQTLSRVHGQIPTLTVDYGRGAFINYHELVLPIAESLPTLDGAPDQATVDQLVDLLNQSVAALAAPCLLPDCDWESQVQTFDETKDALLAATE